MIKSSFYSFETAKRAIMNSQLGLDVTGNNVANTSTAGYTRQRVDQVSFGTSGYRSKFSLYGSSLVGQGSMAIGISQVRDPYLDNRYRAEYASIGEYGVKYDVLQSLASIFDGIQTDGLWMHLNNLIDNFSVLAADANDKNISQVLLSMAKNVTQVLNKNSNQLDTLLTQTFDEMKGAVNDINSLLAQISEVNKTIREEELYGNPALELRDYRNMLIDDLSQYIDITVEYRAVEVTKGNYVQECFISIKGQDIYLVENSKHNEIAVEPDGIDANDQLLSGGYVSVKVIDGISKLELNGIGQSDITGLFYKGILGGQLGGYVNGINGTGNYTDNSYVDANGNSLDVFNDYRGIQYYRRALADFAVEFATIMNDLNVPDYNLRINDLLGHLNRVTGELNTETDPDVIAKLEAQRMEYMQLLDEILPLTDTSGNPIDWDNWDPTTDDILIGGQSALLLYDHNTETWADDMEFDFSFNPDGSLAGCDVTVGGTLVGDIIVHYLPALYPSITDMVNNGARRLFTWDPDNPAGTLAPTNEWINHKDWLTTTLGYGIDGTTGTALNDNLQRFYDALTNSGHTFGNGYVGDFLDFSLKLQKDTGADQNLNTALLAASNGVWDGIVTQRDSISAVSADEEAINMLIYQNYYNAAARYMTTLDEALNTVINGMGLVGR